MIILIAVNDADDDVDIDADIDVDVDADVVGFLTLMFCIRQSCWLAILSGVTFLPLEETTFQLGTCDIKVEENSLPGP